MSLPGMWLSWCSLAEQPGCGCLPEAARVMQHPLLGGGLRQILSLVGLLALRLQPSAVRGDSEACVP